MTKDEINDTLKNDKRYILCHSDYKNNKTKMEWECVTCGCVWFTTQKSVMGKQKTGCPDCNSKPKYSNKTIDERLEKISSPFVRIENYINVNTKIKFKCKKCGYEWETKPNNILSTNKTGCANCNGGIKLDVKNVDEQLNTTNFERIDEYKNNFTKMRFFCKKCGGVFYSTFNLIKINNSCRLCDQVNLTNEIIDERLSQYNIKRIDDFADKIKVGSKTKIKFKCLNIGCGNFGWAMFIM